MTDRSQSGSGRQSPDPVTPESAQRRRSSRLRARQRESDGNATPTTTQPQSQRQFMFVDSSVDRATSSEAVRVHVMRESHRARRSLQGVAEPDVQRGQMTILSGDSYQANANLSRSRTPRAAQGVQRSSSDPHDLLVIGRQDPHGQDSIPETAEVDVLVDYCTLEASVPQLSSGPVLTSTTDIQHMASVSHELLPLYRKDAASFNALLALVAEEKAAMPGSGEAISSEGYQAQVLQLLRSRVADADDGHDDGTIMAIALMANLEEFRANNDAAKMHWSAARVLIRDRGGMRSIWDNRPIHTALICVDISNCTTGTSSFDHPYAVSADESVPSTLGHLSSPAADSQGTSGTTEQFQQLFEACRSRQRQINTGNIEPFLIAATVERILTDSTPNSIPQAKKTLRCAKMAYLLYLTVTLMTEVHPPERTVGFMNLVHQDAERRVADHRTSVEELLYAVLQGLEDDETHSPDRVWLVSRLMGVAKTLPGWSWNEFYHILLGLFGIVVEQQ